MTYRALRNAGAVAAAAVVFVAGCGSGDEGFGVEVETDFMNACAVGTGGDVSSCRCAYDTLEGRYTRSDFIDVMAGFNATGEMPDEVRGLVLERCEVPDEPASGVRTDACVTTEMMLLTASEAYYVSNDGYGDWESDDEFVEAMIHSGMMFEPPQFAFDYDPATGQVDAHCDAPAPYSP